MEKKEWDAARVTGFNGGFGEEMKRRCILRLRVRTRNSPFVGNWEEVRG